MNIPRDQTDPAVIEKVKSLYGVPIKDHRGSSDTAFDYLYGMVFYVTSSSIPEFDNSVGSMLATSYIEMYERYLDRLRVEEEGNDQQFFRDNGKVAMCHLSHYRGHEGKFPYFTMRVLSEAAPRGLMGPIFNAILLGREITIHLDDSTEGLLIVIFEFNKRHGAMYWTLEKDPTSECGYTSTCSGNASEGIHCYNHRHMDRDKMDSILKEAIDEVFGAIKETFCTDLPIKVDKSGTKFILPGHVCVVEVEGIADNSEDKCRLYIKFGKVLSDTRYRKYYAETAAIPKAVREITNEEFHGELRALFDKKAGPLLEVTKSALGLQ